FKTRNGKPKTVDPPAALKSQASRAVAHTSIVVLPFANLSSEPDDDYFSDGLTEELIHLLTRVPGLRVVAWNSAARLRGQEHDLASIRQQLNVGALLRG